LSLTLTNSLSLHRLAKSHQTTQLQPTAVPNPNPKQSSDPNLPHRTSTQRDRALHIPDYDLQYSSGGGGGRYNTVPVGSGRDRVRGNINHNSNILRNSTGSMATAGTGTGDPSTNAKFLAGGHGLVGVAGLSNAMVRLIWCVLRLKISISIYIHINIIY